MREELLMDRKRTLNDKSYYTFVKGIAIILMIIHHSFGFPDDYIVGISYPDLTGIVEYIRNSTKICVPIFVFLTGGGFAFVEIIRLNMH